MTSRTVNRLHGMEIDEISLVDRPANQHGLVAIAKRAEEPSMALFDAEGNEVSEDELEYGEFVTDEAGNEFYMASPEELEQLGYGEDADVISDGDGGTTYDFDDELEDDLVGVGKAFAAGADGTRRVGELARNTVGARARRAAYNTRSAGKEWASAGVGNRARRAASNAPGRVGRNVGRVSRDGRVRAGTVGVGTGVVGYEAGRMKKSLGDSVLAELSKALDNGSRDEVISKLADYVDDARYEAERASAISEALLAERELAEYIEVGKSYELPVDETEFGGILMAVSKALSPGQLEVLDRVLSTAGAGLDELGYNGYVESDVMSQVSALATNAVSKNTDFTEAQAVTALFAANPDAYDEYIAESR